MHRIFCALFLAAFALTALAQDVSRRPSTEEIIKQLKPAPALKTRALGNVDRRGIRIEGASPVESVPLRAIDLEVNFEYASATLSPDARLVLDNLGKALSDPALNTSRFQVAGHTDAAGGESYNITLSKRRALSVADYLFRVHGIVGARLEIAGFGASKLRDGANPLSAVNRRVQIVNLGAP